MQNGKKCHSQENVPKLKLKAPLRNGNRDNYIDNSKKTETIN